jgi:hypothetical protein
LADRTTTCRTARWIRWSSRCHESTG